MVSCGLYHTAALGRRGRLWTWGDGGLGQLGHADTCTRLVPAMVEPLCFALARDVAAADGSHKHSSRLSMVACGHYHTAAVTADGRLFTWGAGCSRARQKPVTAPVVMPLPPHPLLSLAGSHSVKVVQVACGAYHTLAVSSEERLYAWGAGASGQLGLDVAVSHLAPALVQVDVEGEARAAVQEEHLRVDLGRNMLYSHSPFHANLG
jgi:alpha-tubulin suppressor-like RCC1 family protein